MSLAGRMFNDAASLNRSTARGSMGTQWTRGTGSRKSDPLGLIAFAGAIRMISETVGSYVMRVYEGDASERQPVLNAPQAGLLQNGADGYCTSIDMWSDVVTSIEIWENGFIYKGRDTRKAVRELYAFPPELTCVYVDDRGRKIVEARTGSQVVDITADVIHIKGWSPIVGVTGQSPLKRHARTLSGQIAMQEFRGRFFDNDATPNLLLSSPGQLGTDQRRELRDSWQSTYGGPNGSKVGILWGGITATQLSSTLEQAQVEQLMELDVMDIARIFPIYPRELLISDTAATLPEAENITDLFQRFTTLSRERRIERAISGDRELFPDPKRYCRFDSAEFTRGSVTVVADKVHKLKQVGMITANEGRAELGLPPSDDENANKLLETPVGAGANRPNPGGTDE